MHKKKILGIPVGSKDLKKGEKHVERHMDMGEGLTPADAAMVTGVTPAATSYATGVSGQAVVGLQVQIQKLKSTLGLIMYSALGVITLVADTIRARTSAGISITDDAGNLGIQIADGGAVTTNALVTVGTNTLELDNSIPGIKGTGSLVIRIDSNNDQTTRALAIQHDVGAELWNFAENGELRGLAEMTSGLRHVEQFGTASRSNGLVRGVVKTTFADDPLSGGTAQKTIGTIAISDASTTSEMDMCAGLVSIYVMPDNSSAAQSTLGLFSFCVNNKSTDVTSTMMGSLSKVNTGVNFTSEMTCQNNVLTVKMTFTSYDAAFADGGTIKAVVNAMAFNNNASA